MVGVNEGPKVSARVLLGLAIIFGIALLIAHRCYQLDPFPK